MKFLITGANGFIGKRLCAVLSESGHNVKRAVRRYDGVENTIELTSYSSDEEVDKALCDVDCVIHLAAINSQIIQSKSKKSIQDFRYVNTDYCLRLANASKNSGVKRFIFTSTYKIQNNFINQKFLDDRAALQNIKDPYVYSKMLAELELQSLQKVPNFNLVVIRIPIVYGPNVKGKFLFLLRMIDYRCLTFFPILNIRINLIYIENLISALVMCGTIPQRLEGIIYVEDSKGISITKLIIKMAGELNRNIFIFKLSNWLKIILYYVMAKLIKKIIFRKMISINERNKIQNQINWIPKYSTYDGINKTVEWYKSKALKK